LAFVVGLKELEFKGVLLGGADMELQGAIADIVSLCYKGRSCITGPGKPRYRARQTHHEHQHQQQQIWAGRQPLAQLKRLSMTIVFDAMRPLALLLTGVDCLSIDVLDGAEPDKETDSAEVFRVFQPIGTLRKLRVLRVILPMCSPLSAADLQALHPLIHLREVHLSGDCAEAVRDSDFEALLRALPRLSTLELDFSLPRLSSEGLRVVASAGPQLRRLFFNVSIDLAVALSHHRLGPLLPSLESLGVGKLESNFELGNIATG
jgi:hypothetical protein